MKQARYHLTAIFVFFAFFLVAGSIIADTAAGNAEFFIVCQGGTPGRINQAIKAGADINARDDNGWTPLMHAAYHNPNPDAITALANAGAEVNARQKYGMTPLLWAAYHNPNPAVAAALLEAGADPTARTDTGEDMLSLAKGNKNPDVFRMLHGKFRSGPATPEKSVPAGNAMSDERFLRLCGKGTPEEIGAALNEGANVNARDKNGWTALMHAAYYNPHAGTIGLLLDAGCDVNAAANNGVTPLMRSFSNSNQEVPVLLLKAGADVNARQWYGKSPLMFAAEGKTNLKTVSLLLEAGAHVNARDGNGKTPLMYAVGVHADYETAALLLKAGADAKARDNRGRMAIDLAEKNVKLKGSDVYRLLKDVSY